MDSLDALLPDKSNIEIASGRSIILMQPVIKGDQITKGVLLITFTATFSYYYYHLNLEELVKYYHIVLEPSSAGYCDPEIMFFIKFQVPVIVQATETLDREFLGYLDTNLKTVDFGASDWVDYTVFKPGEVQEKIYDSVYVANYNNVKRIEVYLHALKEIQKRNIKYKAALVCSSFGKYRSFYLRLIENMKLDDMLDLYEDLDKTELNELLCKSKVNMLLSLKEGSNRSIFESMFADVPAIVLKNNIGTNKVYINKYTGQLIEQRDLVPALIDFTSSYLKYSPRNWAMKNISPDVSTEKLATAIADFADVSRNSLHLEVKTNNPEVNYFYGSPRDKVTANLQLFSIFEHEVIDRDRLVEFIST